MGGGHLFIGQEEIHDQITQTIIGLGYFCLNW